MAAVASVAINVDSRGAPAKLKQVADRSKQVEKAVEQMNGDLRRSKREFTSTGNAASQAAGGFSKLVRGLAGAAAGFATVGTAAALAGRAIQSAIGRTESERRLQILASSYGEVAQIQNVAAASAKLFGQSQTETNQSIATAYARLRPLGISLDEISSTYNGFNTAARLSGSTAQEASAAFTQLAQALGSGVLRGDEFNSIAEQAPGLLQGISKELNVAVGELRDYAKDGKITSDVVINALKAIEKEGAAPLAEAMNGPEQKLKDLQNETDNLNAEIGKLALPALITVVGELTEVIRTASENTKVFSQVMNGLGKEFEFVLGPLGSFYEYIGGIPGIMATAIDSLFSMLGPLKQVAQLIAFISGETLGPALQRAQAVGSYTGMADAPEDVRRALNPPARPTIATSGGGGKTKKTKSAKPQKSIAQQVAELNAIVKVEEDISKARQAGNKILEAQLEAYKRQLEIQHRGLDPQLEELELKRNGMQLDERLNKLQKERLEYLGKFLQGTTQLIQDQTDVIGSYQDQTRELKLQAEKGKEFVERLNDIKKLMMDGGLSFDQAFGQVEARTAAMAALNKEADMFQQALSGAGDIIGNQLRGAIDGLIDGTADWNDILQSTLKQLGSFLINFGLNALAGPAGSGGILSFLGFGTRANGGPVTANQPYIVGERGPELFMPNQSGAVVNNNQLSSAMNRYRRSGTTATNESAAAMQGGEGGTAVLDKPIDVRYTVERINNVDYVTAEQFQAGMRQAAQQGAAQGERRALTTLRQNTTQRKRIGI